jgi:hypothetical protein
MRTSDSKNSLAELNPPEPICFVCLEESSPDTPLVDSSLLRSCGCKFHTHTECWNKWLVGKTNADCPYCGRRTIHLSIPMTAPFQRDYTVEIQNLPKRKCTYKKILFMVACIALTVFFVLAFFL